MKSDVILRLEKDAVLRGSPQIADYAVETAPLHWVAYWKFVYSVAADVAMEFPGFLVDAVSCLETTVSPRAVRPRGHVRVCGDECSWVEPLVDSKVPKNIAYWKELENWSAISHDSIQRDGQGPSVSPPGTILGMTQMLISPKTIVCVSITH